MKLIESKAEYLPQSSGLEGVYKQIELAGRTCYKSEDKITEDSAKGFVDRMIASKHLSMLEHGTVYLYYKSIGREALPFFNSPYVKINTELGKEVGSNGEPVYEIFVTTNLRFIEENNLQRHLQFICEPTKYHEKRYTFKLTTSIGVTRELNRHRVHSIAEQSTRYCNFSKDKFDNQVSFCIPEWVDRNRESNTVGELGWLASVRYAERNYLDLIKEGWQPQQAREVLPLCTATEIVHTAFASDWRHFFGLRLFEKTGKVHPNMKQLAKLMKEEAEKAGIYEDIMNHPSKFE